MPFEFDDLHPGEFPIQQQQFDHWCWAACTVSLCNFYGSHFNFDQPHLVAAVFKEPVCELGIPFEACNQSCDFDIPLRFVELLREDPIEGTLSPERLIEEVSAGTPVGCQISLPDGNGHAVLVVSGVSGESLHIADPSNGSILTMSYSEFRNNYLNTGGRWARTYLTKRS